MTDFEIRTDPNITTANSEFIAPEDWIDFHDITERDGDGLTVAVMDSGIDDTHPIFDHFGIEIEQPEIDGLPTNQEDNVGHGTAAAGVIALLSPGIDKLVNVPIFGNSGRTDFGTIETAYDWLIDNVERLDRVNMSWGASRKIQQIDRMHNELEQSGLDAIVAAGNTDQQTGSPATANRAFSVAACTIEERMTRFSSPTDNVAALGRNIGMPSSSNGEMGRTIPESEYTEMMSEIGGEWIKASGTSFSAPGVLGMTATLQTVSLSMMNADVTRDFEKVMIQTARDIKGTDEDGEGYVDFDAALEAEPEPTLADARVWSLPWGKEDFIHIDYDGLDDGDYKVDVEKLREAFQVD